jgi:hypothetical protein
MRTGDRVRSTRDGQVGYIAEDEEGRMAVRLDRPAEERVVPYREREWVADEPPKLTPLWMARICYAADAELRQALNEYNVRTWLGLRDQERIPWLKGPPASAVDIRQRVYDAIKRELEAG